MSKNGYPLPINVIYVPSRGKLQGDGRQPYFNATVDHCEQGLDHEFIVEPTRMVVWRSNGV
ncbi:hypothetical protein BJX65DRAFT_285463 [Aspergillus insuetus]